MTGARNGAMHVEVDDAVVLSAFHSVEAAIARIALGYEVACAPREWPFCSGWLFVSSRQPGSSA